MIRRHPHVFDQSYSGDHFTAESWDRIKQSETGCRSFGESLNQISTSLPSLKYADKLIRKLSRIPSLHRTDEQISASLTDLAERLAKENDKSEQERLLAELLICCTELANRLGADCEVLLHQTAKKMIQSVLRCEKDGKDISKCPEGLTFNDFGI